MERFADEGDLLALVVDATQHPQLGHGLQVTCRQRRASQSISRGLLFVHDLVFDGSHCAWLHLVSSAGTAAAQARPGQEVTSMRATAPDTV